MRTSRNLTFLFVLLCAWTAGSRRLMAAPGDLDPTFGTGGQVIFSGTGSFNRTVIQGDGKTVSLGVMFNGTSNVFTVVRCNTDGSPDTTFNSTGTVTFTPPGTDPNSQRASGLALQSDGKIVMAASVPGANSTVEMMVVRFNNNGTLDTTFNNTGSVITKVGGILDYNQVVAVQSDGKIVTAGESYNGSHYSFALVRYTSNGNLDTTFNGTGMATVSFGGDCFANDLKFQSDGKILVCGQATLAGSSQDFLFGLVRLNTNGTLDTTFNGTGMASTESGVPGGLAVQTDGKIVMAGGGVSLVRYNTNGSLDTTFNGTGQVNTSLNGTQGGSANSVAIQPDGKILTAGAYYYVGDFPGIVFARYNADGSLDTTFNGTGVKLTGTPGSIASVVLQSDGSIVAGGALYSSTRPLLERLQSGLTVPAGPFAGTSVATHITPTTATLNGVINARGLSSTVSFDYGLTTSYGSTVSANPGTVTGSANTSVSAAISGLTASSTYHYRVRATNSSGTGLGPDMTLVPVTNDPRLASLTLSSGTLSPAFDSNTASYAATVSLQTASVTVTGTLVQTSSSLTVNGTTVLSGQISNALPLVPGNNVITIVGTAPDGMTTMAYTLNIQRQFPAPGQPDPTFNTTGSVVTQVGFDIPSNVWLGMALQSDGKIVLGGSNDNLELIRYNGNGSIDTTFGSSGRATVTTASMTGANAVALQPDGKIVAVATAKSPATGKMILATSRFTTAGQLDTSFNFSGAELTDVNDQFTSGGPGGTSTPQGVVVQPDGKIVVTGSCTGGNAAGTFVVRYNTDGSLDTSFNSTGIVISALGKSNSQGFGVALQTDGKILVCGTAASASFQGCFSLVRYNTNGSLDTTFNGTGLVLTPFGSGNAQAQSLVVQPDGKIVLAGYAGGSPVVAVARYNTDGSLDTTFNGTGTVTTSAGVVDWAYSVALQGNGKIVVADTTETATGGPYDAVLRYLPNGSLDTTFNGTGIATVPVGFGNDSAYSIAVQSDGNIVVGGYLWTTSPTGNNFTLLRLAGDPAAIEVDQPASSPLTDGTATVDFGYASSFSPASQTFTIKSTGGANLTGLGITFDGPNASDFSLATSPVVPVASGGSTTFTVRFLPSVTGSRTAALHIASNINGPTNPFDINLTGTAVTPQQNWRQQYFQTTANSGNAADNADPDGDGVPNLVEFAMGTDPTKPGAMPAQTTVNGTNLEFTYTRSDAALGEGVQFFVEWSDTLQPGTWSTSGVTESILSDNGTLQQVQATVPQGGSSQRFIHLRVVH